MMILRYEDMKLDELRKQFSPSVVTKALTKATNNVMGKARTRISKNVRTRYTVSAAAVAKVFKPVRASYSGSDAMLVYMGHRISMINFSAKMTNRDRGRKSKKVLKVKVRRDQSPKRLSTAFIAVGKNDNRHVFRRLTSAREPFKVVRSLSIPEMVSSKFVLEDVFNLAEKELRKDFKHQMDFYLGKLGAK